MSTSRNEDVEEPTTAVGSAAATSRASSARFVSMFSCRAERLSQSVRAAAEGEHQVENVLLPHSLHVRLLFQQQSRESASRSTAPPKGS